MATVCYCSGCSEKKKIALNYVLKQLWTNYQIPTQLDTLPTMHTCQNVVQHSMFGDLCVVGGHLQCFWSSMCPTPWRHQTYRIAVTLLGSNNLITSSTLLPSTVVVSLNTLSNSSVQSQGVVSLSSSLKGRSYKASAMKDLRSVLFADIGKSLSSGDMGHGGGCRSSP